MFPKPRQLFAATPINGGKTLFFKRNGEDDGVEVIHADPVVEGVLKLGDAQYLRVKDYIFAPYPDFRDAPKEEPDEEG